MKENEKKDYKYLQWNTSKNWKQNKLNIYQSLTTHKVGMKKLSSE